MNEPTVRWKLRSQLRRFLRRRGYWILLIGILGAIALWRTVSAPRVVTVGAAVELPRLPALETRRVTAHWDLLPLSGVLADLSKQTGVRFDVDWPLLRGVGIAPETRISLETKPDAELTLGQVWGRMGLQHLEVDLSAEPVLVSTREGVVNPKRLVQVVYPVADFVELDTPWVNTYDVRERQRNLRGLITDVVTPGQWKTNGGFADILITEKYLVIDATPAMHEQINALLTALRKR